MSDEFVKYYIDKEIEKIKQETEEELQKIRGAIDDTVDYIFKHIEGLEKELGLEYDYDTEIYKKLKEK